MSNANKAFSKIEEEINKIVKNNWVIDHSRLTPPPPKLGGGIKGGGLKEESYDKDS